jgi:inosine/xanthosine triphosphate pyrophosphatase family protein
MLSAGEMAVEDKNRVSHRAQALAVLAAMAAKQRG